MTSKSAKMIRKNRIIVIGGQRLRVLADPVVEEDPALGALHVFRCLRQDGTECVVRRTPNARIEVVK